MPGHLTGSQAARQAKGPTVAGRWRRGAGHVPYGAGGGAVGRVPSARRRRPSAASPCGAGGGGQGGCSGRLPLAVRGLLPGRRLPLAVRGLPPARRRLPGRGLPAPVGGQPPTRRRRVAGAGPEAAACGLRRERLGRRGGGFLQVGRRLRRDGRVARRGGLRLLASGVVVHGSPVSGRRRFYTPADRRGLREAGDGGRGSGRADGQAEPRRQSLGGLLRPRRGLVYSRLARGATVRHRHGRRLMQPGRS